jgi:hypothetical protein
VLQNWEGGYRTLGLVTGGMLVPFRQARCPDRDRRLSFSRRISAPHFCMPPTFIPFRQARCPDRDRRLSFSRRISAPHFCMPPTFIPFYAAPWPVGIGAVSFSIVPVVRTVSRLALWCPGSLSSSARTSVQADTVMDDFPWFYSSWPVLSPRLMLGLMAFSAIETNLL